MKLFILSVFFSFLLAKAETLMLALGKGSVEDDYMSGFIMFFKNVLENSFLKDIPIYELVNFTGMEEFNIMVNTLITYTPIIYICLFIGFYIIYIPIKFILKLIIFRR